MEIADGWYTKEVECPYCGKIQEANGDMGDEEICVACGKTFELPEFSL